MTENDKQLDLLSSPPPPKAKDGQDTSEHIAAPAPKAAAPSVSEASTEQASEDAAETEERASTVDESLLDDDEMLTEDALPPEDDEPPFEFDDLLAAADEEEDTVDADISEETLADEVSPELPWLTDAPSLDAIRADPRLNRLAGAVIGGAIGDAMGHPTEFISSFEAIKKAYGPKGVTKYELFWHEGDESFAPYTDDTQMAEVVLRALLWGQRESADLDATMEKMAQGFIAWSQNPQRWPSSPGQCMHEWMSSPRPRRALVRGGRPCRRGLWVRHARLSLRPRLLKRPRTSGALVGCSFQADPPRPHRARRLGGDGRRRCAHPARRPPRRSVVRDGRRRVPVFATNGRHDGRGHR